MTPIWLRNPIAKWAILLALLHTLVAFLTNDPLEFLVNMLMFWAFCAALMIGAFMLYRWLKGDYDGPDGDSPP